MSSFKYTDLSCRYLGFSYPKNKNLDYVYYLLAVCSSGKSKNILNALEHAHDCLGSTFSIFGMDGEDPFPSKNFEHDYIHIDSYNYGVIELCSEIILHGIVEDLVIE